MTIGKAALLILLSGLFPARQPIMAVGRDQPVRIWLLNGSRVRGVILSRGRETVRVRTAYAILDMYCTTIIRIVSLSRIAVPEQTPEAYTRRF